LTSVSNTTVNRPSLRPCKKKKYCPSNGPLFPSARSSSTKWWWGFDRILSSFIFCTAKQPQNETLLYSFVSGAESNSARTRSHKNAYFEEGISLIYRHPIKGTRPPIVSLSPSYVNSDLLPKMGTCCSGNSGTLFSRQQSIYFFRSCTPAACFCLVPLQNA